MKRTFKFNKLIRDKLYQKMHDYEGVDVNCKDLSSSELKRRYFNEKLQEEAQEVAASSSDEETIRELADVLEVIHGFANLLGVDFQDIEKARQEKLQIRGGFQRQIAVNTVSLEETLEWAQYFLAHPDRYPEVIED